MCNLDVVCDYGGQCLIADGDEVSSILQSDMQDSFRPRSAAEETYTSTNHGGGDAYRNHGRSEKDASQ